MNRFKGNEGRIQNIEDIKRDLDRAVDEKYAIIEIATGNIRESKKRMETEPMSDIEYNALKQNVALNQSIIDQSLTDLHEIFKRITELDQEVENSK